MQPFIFRILGSSLVLLALMGCKETFEEDIREEKIVLTAPENGYSSTSLEVDFYWQPVEGADEYNIQIAKPDFTNTQKIVLDSNVSDNAITYQFEELGQFEWRVYGFNHGYKTLATYRKLSVDSVDFSQEKVVLKSPVNNANRNYMDINFNWFKLPGAVGYDVHVSDGSLVDTVNVNGNSLYYNIPAEGSYDWWVIAYNSSGGASLESNRWTLNVDTTPPMDPILNLPVPGDDILNDTANFSWSHPVSSSYDFDSIFISSDSSDQNIVLRERGSGDSYEWINTNTGRYYWFVKAYDNAGNESGIDEIRSVDFL